MSSTAFGAFQSVFSFKDLGRGSMRTSIVWALAAVLVCGLLLVVGFLFVSGLHNEGQVWLTPKEKAHYHSYWDPQWRSEIPDDDFEILPPARVADQGLRATTWELRDRAWSGGLYRVVHWWSGFETTGGTLFCLVLCGLCLGSVHGAISARITAIAATAASRIARQLHSGLHRHSLRLGISDLDNQDLGRVDKLFLDDCERVRRGVAQWIERLLIQPGRLIVSVVLMFLVDPKLGFECAVPAAGCLYLVARMRQRERAAQALEEDRGSVDRELLMEGMHASRLIKGYRLDDFEAQRFEKHLERRESRLIKLLRRAARQQFLTRLLGMGCATFVVSMVAMRLLTEVTDPNHLTLGESALLVTLLALTWRAIDRLQLAYQECLTAGEAVDRIQRFMNLIPAVSQAVGAKFLQPARKSIQFENVTYRQGSKVILDKLSLQLPAMSTTAIVAFDPLEARVLAALLPRFIEPSEGKVLIDGEDIAAATLESLRTEILTVDEDAGHLTGTILESLSGGDSKYTLTKVTEAAKAAHAHNFIQKLTQGYETVIGQHGESLDAGQSFRLALARAILRDPALLIIREPTRNLTDDDKSLVDDTCRRIAKDRTVIVLPTRLPTIKQADRIVLLNRGKVEAFGTHEALVETSPLYRHWEYMHFNEFRHTISHSE